MKSCLICYRKEKGTQQPDPDCDFICSNCVQKLCRASQEQIKAIYQKAVDQGSERKAEVLKTFIWQGEDESDQQNPRRNASKCTYRKRSVRAPRNEQKPNRGFKKKQSPAFYQGQR